MAKASALRVRLPVVVLSLLAVLLPAWPGRAAGATVQQLITVTAASYGTTYATLRVYQVSGTQQTLVFGP